MFGGYMCASSVQACVYLSVNVRVCVCVNVPVYVWERGSRKESVAMHFYTSSHWSLHMKHHGREELNTYSWAISLWCNNTLAVKALKAAGRTHPWAVLMLRRQKGLNPLKLLDGSPDCSITWMDWRGGHGCVLRLNESIKLSTCLTCTEELCYIGYYITYELRNGSRTRCMLDWDDFLLSPTWCK